MIRLVFALFLISFFSCKKSEEILPSNANNPNNSSNAITPSKFVSKSEKYSKINETVGIIVNQNNFLRYITQSEAQALDFGLKPMYRFSMRDAVTHDFNSDGKLDLFAFSTRFEIFPENGDLGRNPGKFFIISDVFGGNRTKIIFDTDLSWVGGSFLLNDYDGDGKKEMAIFNSNAHQNVLYGINNPLFPVRIYKIDQNFNLTYKEVGNPLNMHSGTTGDVDNDGDIDIIQWPLNLGRGVEPENLRYPYVLLNDGKGNFTSKSLLSNQSDFKSKFYDWSASIYELFDLNNDGNLDILFGYNFGNVTRQNDPNNPAFDMVNKKIGILWGNGTGQFDYTNITYLNLSDFQGHWMSLSGAGFTDFDGDGDVDVMLQSTTNNINYSKTYVLYFIENKGNKIFEEATQTYVNGYYELNNSRYTHFYQPMFVDKDGDGDFDMVPDKSTAAWEAFKVIDNLYWEKQGKVFTRKQ
jgi:hypothetical protein